MVFVDTPLDIAMARRLLRDIDPQAGLTRGEARQYVIDELSGYLDRARPLYREFQVRMRTNSDMIVDGTLSIDDIVEKIRLEAEARFPDALMDG